MKMMKWYCIIAVINTCLFFIVCIIIWGLISDYVHNMGDIINEFAGCFCLPSWTGEVLTIFEFFDASLSFPWVILILWIFGNIFFVEFLFRRKTDKVEFLLLYLEVLIAQFLLYLTVALLVCWSLYYPFYRGMEKLHEDAETIYMIDKIVTLGMVFLIIVGFVLTRLLYKRRKRCER